MRLGLLQRGAGRSALGDVVEGDDRPHHVTVLGQGVGAVLHCDQGAVAPPEHLVVDERRRALREGVVDGARARRVGGAVGSGVVGQLVEGAPEQLVGPFVTEEADRRRVDEGDAIVPVDAEDPLSGRVEDGFEFLLPLLEGGGALHPLGDVLDDHEEPFLVVGLERLERRQAHPIGAPRLADQHLDVVRGPFGTYSLHDLPTLIG